MTNPTLIPSVTTIYYIGSIGVPTINFGVFSTNTASACPIMTYEIYDTKIATSASTIFSITVSSSGLVISCIATNCANTVASYSFYIKITN